MFEPPVPMLVADDGRVTKPQVKTPLLSAMFWPIALRMVFTCEVRVVLFA